MNGGQIRTWFMLAAGVVVYTTLTAAGKYVSAGNVDREAFAESLSNPDAGIIWSAAGPANRMLVVELTPDTKDPVHCSAVMDTLLIRQDFLEDAYNRGFRVVSCDVVTESNQTIERMTREITLPPASPAPRVVPSKHITTTLEAVL
jgi:hypothetical protein